MRRAIVVGSAGQDGRILSERLRTQGYAVVGMGRSRVSVQGYERASPTLPERVDLLDAGAVVALVERTEPDEIYYLAAHHHSSETRLENEVELYHRSVEVQILGLVHVLDAVRCLRPSTRVFYAASSRVFGTPSTSPQNEATPLAPRCIYGITKTAGMHACRRYRDQHGLFACAGILFNHESQYRGPRFVSQRIARGAVEAARAVRERRVVRLPLGDLEAAVDWGYAPDYVDAMVRILAQPLPDDYVVATGVLHTVREFADIAFRHVGLDYREFVECEPSLVRATTAALVGDASRLRQRTGWHPTVPFEQMVRLLVEAQLES